ncbi:flagellar hook-basal body complex protein [bacterium]|nr:flagellar hook-basal body complex protein [bacterium]
MSLYGALFSGVSGLKAQGTNLAVISDNISNLNTIGYKAREAVFETLVNNSTASVSYNPGGVLARSRAFNDKQGQLQSTDSPTDIAISGNGFFVVNSQADPTQGDTLYTRAGSFRQDALGNFRNAAGFYLQGWPLDRDGRLPGEPGNLNTTSFSTLGSLKTVNVKASNGIAAATTNVNVGATLDARQTVYPGTGRTVSFATNNAPPLADNVGISASTVLVPTGGLTTGDQLTVDLGNGVTYNYTYGGYVNSAAANGAGVDFTPDGGTIPANATDTFFTSVTAPTGAAATFTINSLTAGLVTFTYKQSSPNPLIGEFNNMQSLANAINEVPGLNARVAELTAGNPQLFISADDANEALTFGNGGATNFTGALGLANLAAGVGRFSSLQDLANKVNASDGVTAVLENPLAQAELTIRTDDPLGSIAFTDNTLPAGTTMVAEMGLAKPLVPGPGYQTLFAQAYDPFDPTKNMAGGNITPQFSRNIVIYDSFGQGHNLTMSFIKTAPNNWAIELYGADAGDVNSNAAGGVNQIATGQIVFNGDGSLRSVGQWNGATVGSLVNPININWTNGAIASKVQFDFGTAGLPAGTPNALSIGLTDGLAQFASDYEVAFVDQNGAEVGSLVGVNIDELGYVIASYNNGESLRLFKLPVADFANPNGLLSKTGNVWREASEAGEVNLREAGKGGTGAIVSGVLEGSNAELAEELTDMIVAQRTYQANTKVISTSDDLLEELNRL